MALPFVYEANGTSTRNITFSSPVETGSPPAFTGSWVTEEVFSTSQYTFFVGLDTDQFHYLFLSFLTLVADALLMYLAYCARMGYDYIEALWQAK